MRKKNKKIKEYLKSKGDSKQNPINVNASILETPPSKCGHIFRHCGTQKN
jgi:hypothetical protein